MRKTILAFMLVITIITTFQIKAEAISKPTQDSEQLRLQDMLLNLLTPYIREDLDKFYPPNILKKFSPEVEPWKIEVIQTKRINGFRGLILEITFEIEPSTAHHVSIGRDRMTYRISYGPTVNLINYTHLKTYNLLPDLQ
ncbi:DUF3888 domain-containing protein [Niallia sp. 01092]|uniref:DUF3888 domain-containing protein n=1 Tax=unclassified Niallia TaxID=2837522 RepID=UPI003FCFFC03